MRIAIVNPIMTTVTTEGLLSASRITQIPPPRTDEDNLMTELAKGIAVFGHEVTVFASDFYRPLHSVSDPLSGVRVVYLPTRLRRVSPPAYIPFIPDLYQQIRDGEYDIVQSEEFLQWGTILSAMATSRSHTRLVIWHELNVKQRFPGNIIQSIYARTLGKAVVRRATLIVPRSWQARDYLANRGIPVAKIGEVICKGIDTTIFLPSGDRNELRRQLGLNPHHFVILSVGRLVPYKGHRYLLLALKRVLDEQPRTKLLIVGDGPEKANLCQLIGELGMEENIDLIEPVGKRELARYYSAADVMALPSSDRELFPNFAVLESLACGTPVIFSKPGGDRELGRDGLCGCHVRFGDVEQLAQTILLLIHNPQKRVEMSKAALDLVRTEFSLEVTARKWLQVYKAVVQSRDEKE